MQTIRRRQLAGEIVTEDYERRGWTRVQAAERMHMSPSTLDRIPDGDDRLTGAKLRSVEGALELPDNLLDFIINGDLDALASIGDNENLRPGVRRKILDGLTRIAVEQQG